MFNSRLMIIHGSIRIAALTFKNLYLCMKRRIRKSLQFTVHWCVITATPGVCRLHSYPSHRCLWVCYGHWTKDAEFGTKDRGYWTSDAGPEILDQGCWIRDAELGMLDQ